MHNVLAPSFPHLPCGDTSTHTVVFLRELNPRALFGLGVKGLHRSVLPMSLLSPSGVPLPVLPCLESPSAPVTNTERFPQPVAVLGPQ